MEGTNGNMNENINRDDEQNKSKNLIVNNNTSDVQPDQKLRVQPDQELRHEEKPTINPVNENLHKQQVKPSIFDGFWSYFGIGKKPVEKIPDPAFGGKKHKGRSRAKKNKSKKNKTKKNKKTAKKQ